MWLIVAGVEIQAGGWFPCTYCPNKTKGFTPRIPYLASLPPQPRPPPPIAQVSCLRIPTAIELASTCPQLQWIHGAALTSPSSTWRASSVAVFSTRGPRLRSGCCPVRRTCHRHPMVMWCRSPTSMSVGLRPLPIDFFRGCCTTTRLIFSISILMGSSTWQCSSC